MARQYQVAGQKQSVKIRTLFWQSWCRFWKMGEDFQRKAWYRQLEWSSKPQAQILRKSPIICDKGHSRRGHNQINLQNWLWKWKRGYDAVLWPRKIGKTIKYWRQYNKSRKIWALMLDIRPFYKMEVPPASSKFRLKNKKNGNNIWFLGI